MSTKKNIMQLSVKMTRKDFDALQKLAVKTDQPMAQVVRQFIAQGMEIEKTKDDIDFIRRQLREELEMALDRRMSRIIKLLIKIGSMSYVSAYFNAMIGSILLTPKKNVSYRQLIEDAKREGAKALGVQNDAVDQLFEDMNKFDLGGRFDGR